MVEEDGPVREDATLFLTLYRGPGMVGHHSPADALSPDHHLRVRAVVGEQPAMRFAPPGRLAEGARRQRSMAAAAASSARNSRAISSTGECSHRRTRSLAWRASLSRRYPSGSSCQEKSTRSQLPPRNNRTISTADLERELKAVQAIPGSARRASRRNSASSASGGTSRSHRTTRGHKRDQGC